MATKARRESRKSMAEYLEGWTGKTAHQWMNRVGELCALCARPLKGYPGLKTSEPAAVISKLAREVQEQVHARAPAEVDTNIIGAEVVGLILVLWGARIGRAKSMDPRRPTGIRQRMLGLSAEFALYVAEALTDDTHDVEYFPGQEWDHPYSPTSRYEPDEAQEKRAAMGRAEAKKAKKGRVKRGTSKGGG